MENFHGLLQRQIRKYLESPDDIPKNVINLLGYISEAYQNFDEDRKLLERALELSSEELLSTNIEFRALIRTLPDIFFVTDKTGKILDCRGGSDDNLILKRSDYKGKNILKCSIEGVKEKFEECFEKIYRKNKDVFVEYSFDIRDKLKFFEARFYNLDNDNILLVVKDITNIKTTQKRLVENEERYKSIIENSSDLIVEASFDAKFLYISPNCEKIVGYKPEELVGTSIFEKVHPDDLAAVIKEFSSAMLEFRKGNLIFRSQHKFNDYVWLDASGEPYVTASGEIKAVITCRDITDKKIEEEENIKSQKLESLSVLAGGIAHDFNNLLTIIVTNLSIAQMSLPENSEYTEIISSAQKASFRASELTNQLRTFAKGSSLIKRVVSLNEFLKESVLFALRGSKVSCEFNFTDDVYVEIDEGQISQVVNNLVINSLQAMPDGGNMQLCTDKIEATEDKPAILPEGEYIKLTFLDEGEGIPKEDINKIFDPYFTTKEKGSGLGLAVTYSILQDHRGLIDVESEKGKGAKFFVYLPIVMADFDRMTERLNQEKMSTSGKLLLMDDEDGIRSALEMMLNRLGYEVDCVKDGQDAILFCAQAKNQDKFYDAAIIDLTIPGGMGGLETLTELKKLDPDLFCIVSTGYSAGSVVENYKDYGFDAYLRKPFSSSELKEVLSGVQSNRWV